MRGDCFIIWLYPFNDKEAPCDLSQVVNDTHSATIHGVLQAHLKQAAVFVAVQEPTVQQLHVFRLSEEAGLANRWLKRSEVLSPATVLWDHLRNVCRKQKGSGYCLTGDPSGE